MKSSYNCPLHKFCQKVKGKIPVSVSLRHVRDRVLDSCFQELRHTRVWCCHYHARPRIPSQISLLPVFRAWVDPGVWGDCKFLAVLYQPPPVKHVSYHIITIFFFCFFLNPYPQVFNKSFDITPNLPSILKCPSFLSFDKVISSLASFEKVTSSVSD